jgi:hypothetical protein
LGDAIPQENENGAILSLETLTPARLSCLSIEMIDDRIDASEKDRRELKCGKLLRYPIGDWIIELIRKSAKRASAE